MIKFGQFSNLLLNLKKFSSNEQFKKNKLWLIFFAYNSLDKLSISTLRDIWVLLKLIL